MSRIGKQIIVIPEGVVVKLDELVLSAKGKLGELKLTVNSAVQVHINEGKITTAVKRTEDGAIWGTTAALIVNLVKGVSEGYTKKLELQGVGFKAGMKGKQLQLDLGLSHPLLIDILPGLTVKVEKNIISISGIDKQLVGEFTAKLRALKKPEPYKGKGLRYVGEEVRRKEGKKAGAVGETK